MAPDLLAAPAVTDRAAAVGRCTRRRAGATFAIGAVAALVLLTGCGADTPRITEARGHPESSELVVTGDTCNAHPTATVEETPAEVRVLLRANRSWGDADCEDAVTLTLATPLGRRVLVDAATGDPVEVVAP